MGAASYISFAIQFSFENLFIAEIQFVFRFDLKTARPMSFAIQFKAEIWLILIFYLQLKFDSKATSCTSFAIWFKAWFDLRAACHTSFAIHLKLRFNLGSAYYTGFNFGLKIKFESWKSRKFCYLIWGWNSIEHLKITQVLIFDLELKFNLETESLSSFGLGFDFEIWFRVEIWFVSFSSKIDSQHCWF